MSSHRHPAREQAQLLPFVALPNDGPPRRDQRDLMERPFFSLSKSRRITPIRYRAGDVQVEVHAVPEHGMASIWDADLLIWAGSQVVEAADAGLPTSPRLRFTPYQFLTSVGRGTGKRHYDLFRGALARLQSTAVRTTIRTGPHWRHHQFSWIAEWEECRLADGPSEGVEFVLPDWFYSGVLDRSLVLSIDPAYFRLSGGIERWLYRVARKHAGRQPGGWAFDIPHLHAKSGSLARVSDFALHLRRIATRQPLPGYAVALDRNSAGVERLRFFSTGAVDRSNQPVDRHDTSDAADIGTSHAGVSVHRTHEPSPNHSSGVENRARNSSNKRSNLEEEGARPVENRPNAGPSLRSKGGDP